MFTFLCSEDVNTYELLFQQTKIDGKTTLTNVKSIMDTWTLQMNYPVVHVSVTTPHQINITQKRFLQNPAAKDPEIYTSPFGLVFSFTVIQVGDRIQMCRLIKDITHSYNRRHFLKVLYISLCN